MWLLRLGLPKGKAVTVGGAARVRFRAVGPELKEAVGGGGGAERAPAMGWAPGVGTAVGPVVSGGGCSSSEAMTTSNRVAAAAMAIL